MEKNYFFKSFQLGKQFLFVLFFLSHVVVAQSVFNAGDRIDVFFADPVLQSTYNNNGNDFYTIADDNGVLSSNMLSDLTSSNNNISPLIGVGDVVVFRNGGVEDGVTYDVVIELEAIQPFSGSTESSDAGNNNVIGTASTTRFWQPNTSGGGTNISFSGAPNNVFDGGNSGPDYEGSFVTTFYVAGTYDYNTNTGTIVEIDPIIEVRDIDNYTSSGGTPVDEFVTFDLTDFEFFYLSDITLLEEMTNGETLIIDSTAGNNEDPTVQDEQIAIRFDGTDVSTFNFSLGSRTSHKGPNFSLRSVSTSIIDETTATVIVGTPCNAEDASPTLSQTTISNSCNVSIGVDLTSVTASNTPIGNISIQWHTVCLLYTSDAADD